MQCENFRVVSFILKTKVGLLNCISLKWTKQSQHKVNFAKLLLPLLLQHQKVNFLSHRADKVFCQFG